MVSSSKESKKLVSRHVSSVPTEKESEDVVSSSNQLENMKFSSNLSENAVSCQKKLKIWFFLGLDYSKPPKILISPQSYMKMQLYLLS